MRVGERIKKLRISKGLTQEDLGEILGVTKGAIQKYENGGITNFKSDTIKRLTRLFELPPSYFIYDDDELLKYDKPAIDDLVYIYFGDKANKFIRNASLLNETGIRKIGEYVEDLVLIEKYRK